MVNKSRTFKVISLIMKNISFYKYVVQLILVVLIHSEVSAQESEWNVTVLNNPAPGYLRFDWLTENHFFVLDNYGIQQYAVTLNSVAQNYKLLKNGLWMALYSKKTYLYNQDLQLIDSIPHIPEYYYDYHEAEVLSNGHYMLLYIDTTKIDLSQIVEGGQKNAIIKSGVLVETDRTGFVYWEWKALDYLKITDVTSDIDLTAANIDLTHINSFVEDEDGNLLISFRHLDEIIKINKSNGNILWRMGGSASKNNEFTFVNDELNGFKGFSHQHSITLLSNGNLLMFDNGNLKEPQYSRTVEYQIDQTNKTATKVWEFRYSPDVYLSVMGSAYRLPNGNTLINGGNQLITEVTPDNTIALSIDYSSSNVKSFYRAYKVITKMNAVSKNISATGSYLFDDEKYITGVNISVSSLTGSGLTSIEKHNYAPPDANYSDSAFSTILPYRWVFSQKGIDNINGTFIIKSNTVVNLEDPTKVTIFKRSKEAAYSEVFQKLVTNYDTTSGEIKADFTGFGEFVIASYKLGVPLLEFPANNAKQVELNGLLKWNKLQGASKYQIRLSTSPDFNLPLIDFQTDSLQYSHKNLNSNSNYYWQVRGISSKDTSKWSIINMFSTIQQILPPELLYPKNSSNGVLLDDSIKWEVVTDADHYWLQISIKEDFSELIQENKTLDSNYLKLNILKYQTKYFWRMIAYNQKDTSKWSETWNFTTGVKPPLPPPVLVSPLNNSVNGTNGGFTWLKVNNTVKYNLQVSLSLDFKNNIIDTLELLDTTFYYSNFNFNENYYWKVKAYSINDSSQWSEIWILNTRPKEGVVILLSPGNDDLQVPVDGKLIWNKIQGADYYKLQISDKSDFQNLIYDESNLINNYFGYSKLKLNTEYFWRAAFIKDTNFCGWSAKWSFTTIASDSLPSPVLNSPGNDFNCIPIEGILSWYSVTNANNYIISVSGFPDFHEIIIREHDISDTQYNYSNLNYEQIYYWRAASGNEYAKSRWSEIRSFLTALQSPTVVFPPDFSIDQPVDGKIIWSVTHLNNAYHLQISSDSLFENKIVDIDSINDVNYSYQLSGLTTYYCRVKAVNNNNQSLWSRISKFTTTNSTAVVDEYDTDRISLFPNPASDKIQLSDIKYIGSEYVIYSVLGEIAVSGKIDNNSINISQLSPGLYYLKIGELIMYFVKNTN
jgi:hypothetical protein